LHNCSLESLIVNIVTVLSLRHLTLLRESKFLINDLVKANEPSLSTHQTKIFNIFFLITIQKRRQEASHNNLSFWFSNKNIYLKLVELMQVDCWEKCCFLEQNSFQFSKFTLKHILCNFLKATVNIINLITLLIYNFKSFISDDDQRIINFVLSASSKN
jgi:hypothetical protein